MNIRRKAVFLSAVISVFLTFSAATGRIARKTGGKRKNERGDKTHALVILRYGRDKKSAQAEKNVRQRGY